MYKLVGKEFVKFTPVKYSKIKMDNYAKKYLFKATTKDGGIEYVDKNGKVLKRISPKNTTNKQGNSNEMEEMEMSVFEEAPPPPSNMDKYPHFQQLNNNEKPGMVVQRISNNINNYGNVVTDTLWGDYQKVITKHLHSNHPAQSLPYNIGQTLFRI